MRERYQNCMIILVWCAVIMLTKKEKGGFEDKG